MQLTYLGHSGFMLEADGKTVLIDPWVTGNPLATMKADDLRRETILLSHAHNDHGIEDARDISKRTGATIISTFELGEWLGAQGATTNPGNHGGTLAFDGGSVNLTPAWHTSSYQTGPDTFVAPGVPAGLVIRFGGVTIYHTGDTALFRDMELIGEAGIDLMCVCIGDHFTMGPKDAARAVRFVAAARRSSRCTTTPSRRSCRTARRSSAWWRRRCRACAASRSSRAQQQQFGA